MSKTSDRLDEIEKRLEALEEKPHKKVTNYAPPSWQPPVLGPGDKAYRDYVDLVRKNRKEQGE
jgi:hypothetical protein